MSADGSATDPRTRRNGGRRGAVVRRTREYERLVAGWHDPARSDSQELRQDMLLNWSKEKSGLMRRTFVRSWRRGCCDSSAAEGSWKRTRVAHVSIGCLQRAELIVGLDRARTQRHEGGHPRWNRDSHLCYCETDGVPADCHPQGGRRDTSLPSAPCLPMDAMPLPNL